MKTKMYKFSNQLIITSAYLLITLLISSSIFAQAPQKMSYQAVIRNISNALVTSTPVGMRISILQGTPTGTPVYVETQTPSTNANGLVNLAIGTGTIVTGTFAGINWATGPYFIKTETDPTGGTAYTIAGTNELLSVPYALFSAGGGIGGSGTTNYLPKFTGATTLGNSVVYETGGNVGIGTTSPQQPLHLSRFLNGSHLLALVENTGSFSAAGIQFKTPASGNQWIVSANETGSGTADGFVVDNITLGRTFVIKAATGNVGIGTASPAAKLDIAGNIKITDGTQGAAKVLTSDAAGLASWQTPAGGGAGWSLTGNVSTIDGTNFISRIMKERSPIDG